METTIKKLTLADYCQVAHKELAEQWDAEKNGILTPSDVTVGSHKKVWWRCDKGHEWLAEVKSRTNGANCPVCTNKSVFQGVNDLATTMPRLAEEWDREKNGPLTPETVTAGARRKVWWRCEYGHSWQAAIFSRTGGTGCPVCAGKVVEKGENDLASTNPRLAAQWDGRKNGSLSPCDVSAGTKRKVWWICDEGHSWQASVSSRANGAGCPYCSGKLVTPGVNDLRSRLPQIAEEWDSEKNEGLTPESISVYSNRKVWWKCPHGHSWRATVASRADFKGCPYCSGRMLLTGFNDLATVYPQIASQWHPTLNGELKPDEVMPGTPRHAWWICGEGHVWKASISSRTCPRKHGCPVCAGKMRGRRNYGDIIAEQKLKKEKE